MKPSGAKCTNFPVFLSLLFLYHATILSICCLSLFALVLLVLSFCSLALVPFPSVLFSSLSTNLALTFFPPLLSVPSFFLHQIFKLFLVCTSLTPMPHYRLMAPTVGFSPPLCATLAFLTPTSAYITPLFSVCPVFGCSVPFCVFCVFYLCCSVISRYILLIPLSYCHCAVSSVLSLLFHQVFPLSDSDVLV